MKCGDLGHKNALGEPCGQTIGPKSKGCCWHVRSPQARSILAAMGPLAKRLKRALPESYHVPEFDSLERIIGFARELARLALTADVESRRIAEARGAATLALSAFSVRNQERLVEAILKLEHGGAAMLLLARLQEGLGDGRRKPLPGRALALPHADGTVHQGEPA